MTTHFVPSRCPHCGYLHTAASNKPGETGTPEKGDVSLCIECGRFGVFDRDPTTQALGLRRPLQKELNEMHRNHDVVRLHMAWVAMKANH